MDPIRRQEHIQDMPSSSIASKLPQQRFEHRRKRKLSDEPDYSTMKPEAKHQIIERIGLLNKIIEPCTHKSYINLLDLSDEILLLVFKQLDSISLIPLSKVCIRLQRLVADKTLWMDADFTSVKLLTMEVHRCVKYLQPGTTKSLKLRGMTSVYPAEQWNVPTLTPGILKSIETRCCLLERLELTEAYIDMNDVSIIFFPHCLRSLAFRKCALSVQNINSHLIVPPQQMRSFLSNMYKYFDRLEELTIEYCAWFDTHDFMILSKLPNLRYLSLKGCANIKDSVPYASLATRFGFKNLEILDLRDTPISDSDVSCFNIVRSLKELKLECPDHLRTENGLHEYNEAERLRVEQLHRLAVPDLRQNENVVNDHAPAHQIEGQIEAARVPPNNPQPAHGVFEIRVVHGDYPRQVQGNQDNLIRIVRGQAGVLINNQRVQPPAPVADRPEGQGSPPPHLEARRVRAVSPADEQNQQVEPIRNDENNHNNVDRQHIVRIINRDLLLQRREHVELENPPLLRRAGDQINAAYQHIFDARGNNAHRPPVLELQPEIAAQAHDENGPVEREQPFLNVHLRFHDAANNAPVQNNHHDGQENNPQPQRVLPHVIIMPGNFPENFPAIANGPGRGYQHQVFVNLGAGQPAPNYVSLISDRGICAYGISRNELAGGFLGGILHHNFTGLERLSVRNYKLVTDISLDHLESAAPHLKLLDVTGTSVTAQGVRSFKLSRPSCIIISDFDLM
uniref:F-box domain-containing protein n=1 Tax=Anopheles coluzzii TaxID=1518534 RepID=A0A6E8VKJ2_ANOCL|nr:uncharacterized protein LOC120949644 [Anopheles coluzzii]